MTPIKLPVYDPAVDGNRILKAAAQVRNQPKAQKLKRDPVTGKYAATNFVNRYGVFCEPVSVH